MSLIGNPIHTALVQTAQAQQQASKARDKEQRAQTDSARRFRDQVDLRVAEVEDASALRGLPGNESEQAEDEHRRQATEHPARNQDSDDDERPAIDLTA